MYIVKREYMIKIISFLSAFALLIGVNILFFRETGNSERKQFDAQSFSAVANICASVNTIKSSMEKGGDTGDISSERLTIHAQCENAKLAANLSGYPMVNTSEWFDGFAEYSKTDMNDIAKNDDYYKKISEAQEVLITVCGNFQKELSIKQIDDLFATQEDTDQLKRQLKSAEEFYYLLNNQPRTERKKINSLAETLFDINFIPDTFKGDYTLPDSVNYLSHNSYAKIYPSGGFLCFMATSQTNTQRKSRFSSADKAAEMYLKELAPYAKGMTQVNKHTSNGIVYYTFCPEYSESIVNYDEIIKLAVSASGYKLLAFDSDEYLKHHKKTSFENISPSTAHEFEHCSLETLSAKTIIKHSTPMTEYKMKNKDNKLFYCLVSFDSTPKIYTEEEYFRFINIK